MKNYHIFISIIILLVTLSGNLKAEEIDNTNLEIPLLRSCSELNSTVNAVLESAAGNLYVGIFIGIDPPGIGFYTSYWPSDFIKIHFSSGTSKLNFNFETVLNSGGFYTGGISSGYVSIVDIGVAYSSLTTSPTIGSFGAVGLGRVLSVNDAYEVALPYIKALIEAYNIDIEIDDALFQNHSSIDDLDPEVEEAFLNKIDKIVDLTI